MTEIEMGITVFWGAGNDFRRFLKKKSEMPGVFDNIDFFLVDSDANKWGHLFEGIRIDSPKKIPLCHVDRIIVTSKKYFEEIKSEIIQTGIADTKICKLEKYICEMVIRYQYERNKKINLKEGRKQADDFILENFVIYTSIIGDYDELKQPEVIEKGVRYLCFTDQKINDPGIWEIVYINSEGRSPQEIVKTYKMLPHRFLSEYNTSVWIDASFTIKKSIRDLLRKYQQNSNILMFPHQERICLYSEAACCIFYELGEKSKIIEQINRYYNEGISENLGLYSGGFIARNHNVKSVVDAMEYWYEETMRSSSRDQISLPYIKEIKSFSIDLMDMNIFDNAYIQFLNHKVRR